MLIQKREKDMQTSIELHPLEKKLIESLRSVGDGTIEMIKIQDGLPVIFNLTLKGLEVFPD